ncbi:hypothetical protein OESDEN_05210 [Oesophagostomum dentatum]|uniref:PHD-finger n=1 Tax=Oesophagostomum dentatum TaxID=61180 RepID=A0A0B1TC45_OESDE|nr:hypothetical protein OESDEN_05210 [Oesophagostomum dentatum]
MHQENDRLKQLRDKIEKPVLQELCNRIHHSTYSLDDLVESIEEYLEGYFIKGEHVDFSVAKDSVVQAKIVGVEKKGGTIFYTVEYDGKEIGKINGRDLRRCYEITESDIRSLILLMAFHQHGKAWQIEENYKKEFNVKDKLAPIFCSSSHSKLSNKIPNTTGREAENPTGLDKFITSGSVPNKNNKSSASESSPFLTSQSRREKRFSSAVKKLQDAWRRRDEPEFYTAASWSAKVLSGVQIDKIPHECHRFAVRHAYNKVKDAETLKKLRTKDERKKFREKVHQERHQHQKIMMAKIKAYFNQKTYDDDLKICDKPLPCPGRIVAVPDGQSLLFTDCLVLTQFLSSLRKFIEADHKFTAKELLDAVHNGRVGFMKCTSKLLGSLLKTLLQDPQHKKLSHFDVRLHEFPIEENTVSELCRAFLMLSASDEEEDEEDVESSANANNVDDGVDNDGDEHAVESGRETPGPKDISQIDIDVCQTFLDRFSDDKEFWELTAEEQLGILGLILNRVLDLRSFKDYIGNDAADGPIHNLKEKISKVTEQVNSWQEELSKIPEIEEVVDITQISRSQARERAEVQKKKDTLERKIEESKNKLEELLEKLALERVMKNQAKRISPIGQDRHFRNYYWFHGNTADDGIWIQDFGLTSYEKFVRECIKAGKPFDEEVESDGLKNIIASGETRTASENADSLMPETKSNEEWPTLEPESYKEIWYRLPDVQSFDDLVTSLGKSLSKQREVIVGSITRGNARDSKSPDPVEEGDEDLCHESLSPLRKSIVQLASDLSDSYLTKIGSLDAFEAEILCCPTINEIKQKLSELADSINPTAIVKRNMKAALQTGHFSCFILDRWKHRLASCHNASAVHLLRSYLDSRIDWNKSVVEKRCNSCGSRRSPESKIACDNCALVVHFYCTRPKLQEKPTFWLCPTCKVAELKKNKEATNQRSATKPNYKDEDECSEGETVEDESDASYSEADDDFFSNKPRRPTKRKGFSIFDDEVDEKTLRAKRPKVNKVTEDCLDLLNRVKSSNRLYRALQAIPPGRATRRAVPSSIDSLEKEIPQYASLSSFAADLNAFFKHAHTYLEEHNERKLEELENLLSELQLHSIIKVR